MLSSAVLECCVSFYCTAKRISPVYTVYPLPVGPASRSGHHRAPSRVPVWYSMSASVTHFIRSISSTYVSVSISQFLTPPLHLFSTSVSLFPLCKWVHLHHFSRCHMYALNMVFVNIQHLFYTSVSLFLLCKQDDLFHFSKCHTYVLIYDIFLFRMAFLVELGWSYYYQTDFVNQKSCFLTKINPKIGCTDFIKLKCPHYYVNVKG